MQYSTVQVVISESLLLILAVSIIFINFKSKRISSFNFRLIEDMIKNWETKLIVDIIKTEGSCPPNYEEMIKEVWPGTIDGCACTPNIIHRHICHENQQTDNCVNVRAVKAMDLTEWKDVQYCIKRSENNYYNLYKTIEIIRNETNLTSTKNQTISNKTLGEVEQTANCIFLDNVDNLYCEHNDEKYLDKNTLDTLFALTPIKTINNSISVSNTMNSTNNSNNTIIKISNNSNVTEKNYYIVEFKVSESRPCLDPDEKNTRTYPYRLLNDKFSYFCTYHLHHQYHDSRYSLLQKELLNDFYDENNLTERIQNLPLYSLPKNNSEIGLYFRGYIGWNQNCIPEVIPDSFASSFQNLYFVDSFQGLISLFAVIFLLTNIAIFIFKRVYSYVGIRREDVHEVPGVMNSIKFCFALLGFVILLLSLFYESKLTQLFNSTALCSDNIITSNIKIIKNILLNNNYFNKFSMWLYLLSASTIILNYLIFYLVNYIKQKKNSETIQRYHSLEKDELYN